MKTYKIIALLLCGIVLLQSCKTEEKKVIDTCTINLNLEEGQTAKVVIYPYQMVGSMEESQKLTITKDLDAANSSFILDTVRVLRNFNASIGDKRYRIELFTGPGAYNLSFVDDKIVVEQGALHQEFVKLNETLGYAKMQKLQYKKDATEEEVTFRDNYGKNLLAAVKEQPKSHQLAALIYKKYWNADIPMIDAILNDFDTSVHTNYYLNELKKRKATLEKVAVGQKAPLFTLKSFEGKDVALKSYRGNYLLIDFWAYWCGPCVAGFPELEEIRKDYTEDELKMLSVSTDQNHEKWVEAVEKYKLPWTQLIDDKTNVSNLYAITAIPHLILISPEGKIIYKHNHTDSLTEELKKILK